MQGGDEAQTHLEESSWTAPLNAASVIGALYRDGCIRRWACSTPLHPIPRSTDTHALDCDHILPPAYCNCGPSRRVSIARQAQGSRPRSRQVQVKRAADVSKYKFRLTHPRAYWPSALSASSALVSVILAPARPLLSTAIAASYIAISISLAPADDVDYWRGCVRLHRLVPPRLGLTERGQDWCVEEAELLLEGRHRHPVVIDYLVAY